MIREIEILIKLLSAMNTTLLDITPQFSAARKSKILQYRLNTFQNNPAWDGTISVRCSRIEDISVGHLISEVLAASAAGPQMVDRVGINLSTAYDTNTQERCIVEGQRTIYLTLRPTKDVFEFIQKAIGQQEDYEPIISLLNVLYEHKFTTEEKKENADQHKD